MTRIQVFAFPTARGPLSAGSVFYEYNVSPYYFIGIGSYVHSTLLHSHSTSTLTTCAYTPLYDKPISHSQYALYTYTPYDKPISQVEALRIFGEVSGDRHLWELLQAQSDSRAREAEAAARARAEAEDDWRKYQHVLYFNWFIGLMFVVGGVDELWFLWTPVSI